jgi:hypothetical protein
MGAVRAWLAPYSWEFVTAQNARLCHAKNAPHKPTSDGHETAPALWLERHTQPMRLDEAVDVCRRCHRLAPFGFYNGNTFAGLMRDVINGLGRPAEQGFVVRSLAGHIVAGVSTGEEERAFQKFCAGWVPPAAAGQK